MRTGTLASVVVALAVLLAGAASPAHVVLGRGSLRQFLRHSEMSLHVEFLGEARMWQAPEGRDRQEYFVVRVLEPLAGTAPTQEVLEFFPHAEGFPGFAPGDHALLFLEASAKRPEFAGVAERFPWFSVQGAGEEWILTKADEDPVLSLARRWAAWLAAGGADVDALREILASGLLSESHPLERDCLLELLRAQDLPGLLDSAAAVARLAPLVDGNALSLHGRAALHLVLAGRPGYDRPAHFGRLAEAASTPPQRQALVRQLSYARDDEVLAWLETLADDPDPGVRRSVVAAQASLGPAANLALLERALGDSDPRVARAAILSLGQLAAPEAHALLVNTAAGEDSDRARWAAAELRRERGSHGTKSGAGPPTEPES